MIDVGQETGVFLETFAGREASLASGPGAWLAPVRRDAMARFGELGFPTRRDEAWRWTDVSPIAKTRFSAAPDRKPATLDREAIDRLDGLTFGSWMTCRLVFVDGRFAQALSDFDELPEGATVMSLAAALDTDRDRVEPHLARHAAFKDSAFTALNTAMFEDGALVWLSRGCVVNQPIHLIFVSTGGAPDAPPIACHPRVLILAERESQATVVESHVGLRDSAGFTNAVTEIALEEGAVLDHCKLQRESLEGFHISSLHADLGRSSVFTSHSIALGGRLVRNDAVALLNGEGAECTLNGLYVLSGRQHVDNHTVVDHAVPHGTSRQLYKGVLDGASRGVFDGLVVVRPDAQKTDSRQENRNLILSGEALADSKPTLKIHADDVKCSHAAATGQLDEQSMFYLRSRAIDPETARRIMIHAFVNDLVRRIKVEPIRAGLDALLFREPAEILA